MMGRTGMSMGKRLGAEFLGTFWLVLGGCGSAVPFVPCLVPGVLGPVMHDLTPSKLDVIV
jgi:glycerol uptake facilitator-like aquaporin